MSNPRLIKDIMKSVSIPIMAKVRIGHEIEAAVDYSYIPIIRVHF